MLFNTWTKHSNSGIVCEPNSKFNECVFMLSDNGSYDCHVYCCNITTKSAYLYDTLSIRRDNLDQRCMYYLFIFYFNAIGVM